MQGLPASVATGLLEETAHRGDTAIQNDQFEWLRKTTKMLRRVKERIQLKHKNLRKKKVHEFVNINKE